MSLRAMLVLVATLYALKSAMWLWLVPPLDGPDEPAHFDYVMMWTRPELPRRAYLGLLDDDTRRRFSDRSTATAALESVYGGVQYRTRAFPPLGADAWRQTSAAYAALGGAPQGGADLRYPPLYYEIGAAWVSVLRPLTDSPLALLFALRVYSALLVGAALLVFALVMERLAVPRWLQLLVLLAGTFHPMLSFQSIYVQPDNLMPLLFSLGMLCLVILVESPRPAAEAGMGVVLGAMLLTKLLYTVPMFAALAFALLLQPGRPALRLRALLVASLVAAVVAGPFLWTTLHSSLGPGGMSLTSLVPEDPTPYRHAAFFGEHFRRIVFPSYWGFFGWLDTALPDWQYEGYRRITIAFLVAGAVAFLRVARRRELFALWSAVRRSPAVRGVVVLAVATVGYVAGTWIGYVSVGFVGFQGRYFFTSLLGQLWLLSMFAVWGLKERLGAALVLGLLALNLVATATAWSRYASLS